MDEHTLRQLHGANDLLEETIGMVIPRIAAIHRSIARQPFAILTRIPPIAAPVRSIECIQRAITDGVYLTILEVNAAAGATGRLILQALARHRNS
ncbi:MAG: hypothetical protein HXY39_06890 [Chloroflexi bacterium]|nr:hypothetical protein [Chloroflexota bacterium]